MVGSLAQSNSLCPGRGSNRRKQTSWVMGTSQGALTPLTASCLFSAGAVADIAGGQEELSVQYHILHRMCRVFTFYNIGPFLYNTNARYFDLNKNKSIYVNQLEDGSPTMLWNRCWGRFSCLKRHVVTSSCLPSTPASQELTQAHCLRYSLYQC